VEQVLLIIIAVVLGLDVITNVFMLICAPKWEEIRREEVEVMRENIKELQEQNEELKQFIRQNWRG